MTGDCSCALLMRMSAAQVERTNQGMCRYLLLQGVNDSEEDASRLAILLKNVHSVVNLITFNPHAGTPFRPSERSTLKAFQAIVRANNIICTVRESKGGDEMAACGQLGNPGSRPVPLSKLHSSAAKPTATRWHRDCTHGIAE